MTRREGRGGWRDAKEGRGGRSDEESEKVAKGRIIGLAESC